jgi:hypothetical protein
MKAHMKPLVLFAAICFVAACSGNKNVPDPKDPAEADPMLSQDPVPERSLENQAGLIITSSPAGVEVEVDGANVGTTPLEKTGLASGEHDVTFLFEGEGKRTLSVNLGEGEFQKVHQTASVDSSDAIMGK